MIPDINDGLFSITSSTSTINTITDAIARSSWTQDVAFILNQMAQANYIMRKVQTDTRLNQEEIRSILLYPSDFGGLPMSSYTTNAVRGTDDNVTTWLGILKACI